MGRGVEDSIHVLVHGGDVEDVDSCSEGAVGLSEGDDEGGGEDVGAGLGDSVDHAADGQVECVAGGVETGG